MNTDRYSELKERVIELSYHITNMETRKKYPFAYSQLVPKLTAYRKEMNEALEEMQNIIEANGTPQ
jgi:hypothetical protein